MNKLTRHILLPLLLLLGSGTAAADTPSAAEICKEATEWYAREEYARALARFINGMEASEREKDWQTYMVCTGSIANIYEAIGDYESDLIYLLKGYDVAVSQNDESLKSIYLINIVAAYCHTGDVTLAKQYYERQKATPNRKAMDHWQYFLIYNRARILQAEMRYQEAVEVHKEAMAYARKHHLPDDFALFQTCEMATAYLKAGNFSQAKAYGIQTATTARQLNNRELLVSAYDILAKAYRSMEQNDSADHYHTLYLTLSDSVFNAQKFYQARNDMTRYETRKSNDHIHSLNTLIDRQLWAIVCISLLLILTATLVIMLVRKNGRLRNTQKLLISRNADLEHAYEQNEQLLSRYLTQGAEETTPSHDPQENRPALEKDVQERLLKDIQTALNDPEVISNADFSLDALARMVGSNRSYVSRVINATYNKNFKTLLNEHRIRIAEKKLADTSHYANKTLQAIYEEVGYTNAASFIRAFRKVNGMTPSDYQRLVTENDSTTEEEDD